MQINEAQVTILEIADIFNRAFIDTSDIQDDRLRVKGDFIRYQISIDAERKFIRFFDYTLLHNVDVNTVCSIINKANAELVFVKFYVEPYEGKFLLISELYMTYEKGALGPHVVINGKRFEKIALHAIREFFAKNLES